jgi:AhpD family alkylhydroperoxidase
MRSRIEYIKAAPELLEAMQPLNDYVHNCGLEPSLIDLVVIRASQINGCAYCIDMHTKDARARGETEQRIYELDAWRETPFYSEREMAALAWTEAVTLITDGHVPDDVYEEARKQFTEVELVNLTVAITLINAWNRLSISFRSVPGRYRPARAKGAERETGITEATYH